MANDIDHESILKTVRTALGENTIPILAAGLKISRQAVHQWRKVPAERAREVERITGIPRAFQRPDIFGD